MSEWPIVTLREVSEVITKGTTPTTLGMVFTDCGVNFIKSESITADGRIDVGKFSFIDEATHASLKRSQIKANDLLFSMAGVYLGKTAVVPPSVVPANTNQAVAIIRLKKEIVDSRYVGYFLRQPSFNAYVNNLVGQSAQPNINLTEIGRLKIKLPPLETQQEIAHILGDLDDKIELNRQINQTLEQIAQTIFKSWFVDFEPVKAKIEAKAAGRDPERAAMCAICGKLEPELDQLPPEQYQQLAATAALFPDELVESELGLIPVGWEMKPFGELLEFSIGGDWGQEVPDEQHTEKVNILRGTDLPRVYGGDDSSVPTRYVESKKLEKRLIIDGDIVIEVSGGSKGQPTGRSLYLTNGLKGRLGGRLEPASFCRLFRPINSEVGLLLAVHLAKIYEDGKTWLYQNQSTGISNFQTTVFLEKELIVVPCNRLLNFFYVNVRPLFDQIYSGESQSLRELRDVLLPKLLSGDINVEAVRGAK